MLKTRQQIAKMMPRAAIISKITITAMCIALVTLIGVPSGGIPSK